MGKPGDRGVVLPRGELQWGPPPDILPPGAQMAVVGGDPAQSGLYTLRLLLPAGYVLAPHSHPNWLRITVLSGGLSLGFGNEGDRESVDDLGPGMLTYIPPGSAHHFTAARETEIQVHGAGPWAMKYEVREQGKKQGKK